MNHRGGSRGVRSLPPGIRSPHRLQRQPHFRGSRYCRCSSLSRHSGRHRRWPPAVAPAHDRVRECAAGHRARQPAGQQLVAATPGYVLRSPSLASWPDLAGPDLVSGPPLIDRCTHPPPGHPAPRQCRCRQQRAHADSSCARELPTGSPKARGRRVLKCRPARGRDERPVSTDSGRARSRPARPGAVVQPPMCRVHASRSFGSRMVRSGGVSPGREATDSWGRRRRVRRW